MILGVDIGNYNLNSSTGLSLESKVARSSVLFSNSPTVELFGKKITIGDGEFDTEYRKIKKENYLQMLYTTICLSTEENFNNIVVGLPISQYKTDKDELMNLILQNSEMIGNINNKERKVIIQDVEIYPEGIGAVDSNFEGILVDIGGRTTDICHVENVNGKKKLINPTSKPIGTLNLYTDFIKSINNTYGLDLKLDDAERVLRRGLKIDGVEVDISNSKMVFADYVDKIVSKLKIEYSANTLDIALLGGGSIILGRSIIKRLPSSYVIDNPIFANANTFKKVGEQLWLRR